MKTVVVVIALFGLAFGDPVSYMQSPCERLDVDATFVTTATLKGQEVGSKNVTTTSDSFAKGTCGNSSSTMNTLIVTFNETLAKWTLMFTRNGQGVVNVRMTLLYKAVDMFPSANLTDKTIVLLQKGKTTLSTSDKSFRCNSEQTIEFDSTTGSVDNATYAVTLTMKNLRVQAFNLVNDTFSGAMDCPADDAGSTPDMSTSEDTSTPSESTTEEKSTTESSSTSAKTTSSATPKTTVKPAPVNTYSVSADNETCIKMTAGIQLMVNYMATDNKTKTATIDVPKTFTVDGVCANGSDTNASMTIMFENNTIEFQFMDKDKTAEIDEITVTVMLDKTNFPDAKTPEQTLTLMYSNVFALSDDETFFRCDAEQSFNLSDESTLKTTDLKVQAFELKNNDFTGNGLECTADSTTASPSTSVMTTTPKPTPTPGPPVNNFSISDGNNTCLLMKASFVLDISYVMKNNTVGKAIVTVPAITDTQEGTCGTSVEELNIKFRDTFEIMLVFSGPQTVSADDTVGLGAVKNYALNNVSITYMLNNEHFPDANDTGANMTVLASELNLFGAAVDGSYKCNADSTVSVGSDVKMLVSNLRYQAFQTGNKTSFNNDNLKECEADISTNSVVPIAVGAALAGLVVIVLIAYLIGRRKSRRAGYESV